MQEIVTITTPQELRAVSANGSLQPLDPDRLVRDAPDAHCLLTDGDGSLLARCSLWWNNTPAYRDYRVGLIGHYAVADPSAARRVLQYACERLSANRCNLAVGPMDGDTWRPYRLVTERGGEPAFFMEPDHAGAWPCDYLAAGFQPLAEYFSALNTKLDYEDPRLRHVAPRMAAQGIGIRSLRREDFVEELRRIHSLTKVCFQSNLFYAPIGEQAFLELYRPLEAIVRPEFVLIAEQHDVPVGFVFAVADLLQAQRGEAMDTVIVKTLAALSGRRYAGLGNLLLDRVRSAARQAGCTRMIHALVRDVPALHRMSGKTARPIRRYALFGKELAK